MNLFDQLFSFRAPNVFNPWRDRDPLDATPVEHAMRLARLDLHFSCYPSLLLIGEAPGYQGCHFSGIPFTNEKLLLDGVIPRVGVEGRLTTRARPWSEPSATIVWNTLHELGIAERTVLWNAFAWHPHKPGEPYSNRAPTPAEIKAGEPVLRAVLYRFSSARVVAVGNVAARTLAEPGVTGFSKVRHPSMGGAKEFAAGLGALMAGRQAA